MSDISFLIQKFLNDCIEYLAYNQNRNNKFKVIFTFTLPFLFVELQMIILELNNLFFMYYTYFHICLEVLDNLKKDCVFQG